MGMYGALTFELIDQLAEATRALEERLAEDGLCTLDRTALQKLDAAKHTAMRLDLERRRTISRLIAGNESAHLTRLQKRIGEQIIQERMERVRAS